MEALLWCILISFFYLSVIRRFKSSHSISQGSLVVLYFLGCLYPVGECVQRWNACPLWVRGYLSDFGWVFFCGVFGVCFSRFASNPRFYTFTVASLGALCAIAVEVLNMAGIPVMLNGVGDVWDIAIFAFALPIALLLCSSLPVSNMQNVGLDVMFLELVSKRRGKMWIF